MHLKPYQAAVGSLNHAAVMTHPDIAKAVQTVAQVSSNPGKHHWDAVIRIIRYLKTTWNWVLTLGGKSAAMEILGYCDADHANSPDHGRSISGYAMMLGNGCSLGHLRNKLLLHYPLERHSIMQLFMQVVKLTGFDNYLQKWDFYLRLLPLFASIILLAFA